MRHYYELTKPGLVYGNLLTALAAFFFGVNVWGASLYWTTLAALLLGLGLSMAGACVFNNMLDCDYDARMQRTQNRALPTGIITPRRAFLFGSALLLLGLATLLFFVSPLAVTITFAGVIVYVAVYTPAKRITPQSTLIGAVSGAVPPVVGYAAAAHLLDTRALILFLILVAWQMTHFFAIALYREEDYRAAGFPVMPLIIGVRRTKLLMFLYACTFSYAAYALYALGGVGKWYAPIMLPACLGWIILTAFGFIASDTPRWARAVFFTSLVLLVAACFAIALP